MSRFHRRRPRSIRAGNFYKSGKCCWTWSLNGLERLQSALCEAEKHHQGLVEPNEISISDAPDKAPNPISADGGDHIHLDPRGAVKRQRLGGLNWEPDQWCRNMFRRDGTDHHRIRFGKEVGLDNHSR